MKFLNFQVHLLRIFNVSFSTLYEKLTPDNKYVFTKMQLDKGCKDKKHLSDDFYVEFYFLMPKQVKEMLTEGGREIFWLQI